MTRRTLFIVGLLVEMVAVFAIALPPYILRQTGTPISLLTVPVDPRSLFRGDYVVLSYAVGRSVPISESYNQAVYVTLEKKGDVYERVAIGVAVPTLKPGQACIRGTYNYNMLNFPDIEQYFVPEGTGHDIEATERSHRLIVDANVSASCRAIITGLRLGPEAPLEQTTVPGMPVPAVR